MTKRDRENIETLIKVLQTHVSVCLDAQQNADELYYLCEDTQHRIAAALHAVRQGRAVGEVEA